MHNNNSPIIKSFIYVGKYFFYDTFSNCLFSVSKEQYTEIILLQNIGTEAYLKLNKDTKSYYDILLLLKRGLMKSKIIDIIEHRDTVYMKELVDRCMCNITLQVTQDCNFKCRYCAFAFDNAIGRVHNKSSISMDIAKRSIDYLYDHSKDIDFLMVAFYGGEPLLNYKLITSIVEYTEKKFFTKNIEYRMTINGSLLNDEIMDFLIKYNFQIAISFDGPREIQDHHRLFKSSGNGTHDVVYNNILKLRKKNISYFNNSVRFISVAFSREEKKNVVHFFESINVDNSKIINLDADLSGVDYISDVNYKYYNRCDDILNSLPADNMPSIISSDDITS